ncbi:MAG: PD40 domain-containing protein [Phaeodactylibacter sp.]|nr:PD40 domain-containing protein [Phaeodactylibacter sp.]
MRILFLSVLACLAFHHTGYGQSLKQVLEAGDESFRSRDYYNAYRCYETVLKYAAEGAYREDTLSVKFRYAQAAQRLNYFSRAKALYGQLSREAGGVDDNIYARSVFNHAKMLQNLAQDSAGYYGQALDTYQFFVSEELYRKIEGEPKIKSRFKQAAESGILSCDSLRNAPAGRKDSLYRLPEPINSGFSELGPVRIGNRLYFSSLRFLPVGIGAPRQSRFYSKQMMATFKPGMGEEAAMEAVDSFIVLPKSEDYNADNLHTLHTAFSQDGQLMFFTRCIQEDEDIFCSLYLRRRLSDGAWGIPQKLALNAEDREYTTTQPSLAFDCVSGKEWLYFSSNRPGTLGGLDIWRAEVKEGGALGEPESLSAINTPWDEATPFFHSPSRRLYFSSDAPPSFGEYDIFYSEYQDGSWSVPENMGIPYNSGYNDQYFFLSPDGKTEYFASDRPRSFRFIEELEFCCTDIYTMVNKVDRVLEVSLEDCDAYSTTEKVVEAYELSCGQRTLAAPPQSVKGRGTVSFTLQLHRQYEIIARSEASGLARTRKLDLSEGQYVASEEKIRWQPEPFFPTSLDMKVTAYDANSGAILEGVTITVAAPGLDEPLPDQGDNVFRIGPNITYEITVVAEPGQPTSRFIKGQATGRAPSRAQNYERVDTTFSFTLADTDKMLRLCGKAYLEIPMKASAPTLPFPIVLYFDHDMPLRYKGRADQTRQSFDDAITRYLEKREDYLANNSPSEARRVNAFFDREVSGGLSTLNNFASSLLEYVDYMEEGDQLVIEIQGYCSPRGRSLYNRLLSKRRIQCIRTYLESYSGENGRKLKDYIGGKIIVRELPLGESRASSAYPDNNPNSIWGIAPALDRRVEIVDLSKGEELTSRPLDPGTQEQEP